MAKVFANRIERNSSPTSTPTIDLSEYAAPLEDPSCDETDTVEDNYDGIDWNRLPNLQKPWVFSELGDLLEPRRLKMKPATISAIQCTRAVQTSGL